MTPEQINELDRLRWLRDELTAWLEAHEKVIFQQAGENERLATRVAELEKVLRYIRSVAVDGETPGALACLDIGEATIAALAVEEDKP